MPREKEAYRDALEDILAFFGEKRMLTVSDVSRYTKNTRGFVRKRFSFEDGYISAIVLAREMS